MTSGRTASYQSLPTLTFYDQISLESTFEKMVEKKLKILGHYHHLRVRLRLCHHSCHPALLPNITLHNFQLREPNKVIEIRSLFSHLCFLFVCLFTVEKFYQKGKYTSSCGSRSDQEKCGSKGSLFYICESHFKSWDL